MKHFPLKNHHTQQIFAALILTGILSFGAGITLVNAASTNSTKSSQDVVSLAQRNRELPRSVFMAVRREIARTYRIPPGQLKVVSYTQQSWPDGCLGLGKPDEVCTQVFIENGWRVVMSDGRQTWIVRSDGTGRIVRLESKGNSSTSNLPNSVANAVLRSAAGQLGVPRSQLRIIQAEEQTWSDRCLGLGSPVELCAMALTPGWRVVVEGQQQRLVYHTDSTGSLLRLNQSATGIGDVSLPKSVVDTVLKAASQRTGLGTSELRIVQYQTIQGSSSCLNLPRPGEACTDDLAQLWQVTVEGRQQRLVYHTNMNGSRIRLNEDASNIGNIDLPQSVANAVVQVASQDTGLRPSAFRVVQFQQIQGSSSCLGIFRPGEGCTKDLVPLWQVSVEARQQRLVYHTNMDGSRVRLNEEASNLDDASLPKAVADVVLQFASEDLRVPSSQLRITTAQKQVWNDSCLGLPRSNERCMGTLTPGWRVTVEGRRNVQVYRTDESGSRIRSEAIAEEQVSGSLPDSVAQAVLQDAARRSNPSISGLRIVEVEPQNWPDGCLGLPERGVLCTQAIVPGWRVTIQGGGQRFVYRTDESGSVIKLESGATQGNSGGAVPMSESELPPPLNQGVVFRAIEGGGFTGSTTETVLTQDGRVIRRYTNGRIMAPVQMHQISRQELQRFLQLLDRQNFAQFDRLAYPAPSGAADYITVTLTSEAGTTSFADMGLDSLPTPLQTVAQAWRQIATRR